jgi:hypothetical protein
MPASHEPTEYSYGNTVAAITVGAFSLAATAIPTFARSEPGHPHPLRELDLLGISNVFDNTGDMDNAALIAGVALGIGAKLYEETKEEDKGKFIVGAATGAGVLSGSSVAIVETHGESFDTADALYGMSISILYPVVFAIAVLRARRHRKNTPD